MDDDVAHRRGLRRELAQFNPDTGWLWVGRHSGGREVERLRQLFRCRAMRWRGILRAGDSGTQTSPPIHLRVRAPKGITEPVDVLDLGILGSYKPLPGRQERRAIVR